MLPVMLTAVIVALLVLVLTVLPVALAALADPRPASALRCACGYDLTGLRPGGVCPECARPLVGARPGPPPRRRLTPHAAVAVSLLPPAVAAAGAVVIWLLGRPPLHPGVLLAAAVGPAAHLAGVLGVMARRGAPRVFAALVLVTPVLPLLVMLAALSGLARGPASGDNGWPVSDLVVGVVAYGLVAVVLTVAAILPLAWATASRPSAAATAGEAARG